MWKFWVGTSKLETLLEAFQVFSDWCESSPESTKSPDRIRNFGMAYWTNINESWIRIVPLPARLFQWFQSYRLLLDPVGRITVALITAERSAVLTPQCVQHTMLQHVTTPIVKLCYTTTKRIAPFKRSMLISKYVDCCKGQRSRKVPNFEVQTLKFNL